ncbi:MAG: cation:proton antiporter [Eubacteriales bacterium]
MGTLGFWVITLFVIVLIGLLNERIFHLQGDIALLLFTLILCAGYLAVCRIPGLEGLSSLLPTGEDFRFGDYLLDFVLCFMLFAGAGKLNFRKFRQNLKVISLLALLTTVISSAVYGLLFWLIALIFGLPVDLWICLLIGCIVSPTDPIAATAILNKLGLSKNVSAVIESESLFNDGIGVALFVFVGSIVKRDGTANFFLVMAKEVLGAVAVALIFSFLLFRLLKLTKDPVMHILISLLDVGSVYVVCEHAGFSGVLASVICGMYFSWSMSKIERRRAVVDCRNLYDDFWEVLESVLNSILFVFVGLSVLSLEISAYAPIVIPFAILISVLSRFAGTGSSALLTGKKHIPGGYCLSEFVMLMTWSALKGGLTLALALSTKDFLNESAFLIVQNSAFFIILFTVLVQGLTVKPVYRQIEKHKAGRLSGKIGKRC